MAALGAATERAVVLLLAERVASLASAALDRAGVPHLFVKGFAVALSLYPDPLRRPFRDVDLAVPWARLGEARRALGHAGFGETLALRTAHAAVLRPPVPGAPDLDLQGWLGYPLAVAGGLRRLGERRCLLVTSSGPVPAPDPLDLACLSALYAVRDRLRPSTAPLLRDVILGRERHGDDALRARARALSLGRVVRLALDAASGRSSGAARRIAWLDDRAPRLMSALPALLIDSGPRAAASFGLSAAFLAAGAALRGLRGPLP